MCYKFFDRLKRCLPVKTWRYKIFTLVTPLSVTGAVKPLRRIRRCLRKALENSGKHKFRIRAKKIWRTRDNEGFPPNLALVRGLVRLSVLNGPDVSPLRVIPA